MTTVERATVVSNQEAKEGSRDSTAGLRFVKGQRNVSGCQKRREMERLERTWL